MSTPDYFSRIAGSVNLPLMQAARVVVVGVGMVGSQITEELAKCGIGHLRLIDHDILEPANLSRHALDADYLGWNKSEAMTVYLAAHIEGLQIEAVPRQIDGSVSDQLLSKWLDGSNLIVAATDDRDAQRRIGRLSLRLGIPAIFPSLYVEGGGEVIVQLDDQLPCFGCWDWFRPSSEPLRGAVALNIIALPLIFTSVRICLGLLDPASPDREMMRAGGARPPYQSFGLNRFGTLRSGHLEWRRDCKSCGGVRIVSTPAIVETLRPEPMVHATQATLPTTSIATERAGRFTILLAALAFAAAPWVIMYFVVPAMNAHPNVGLELLSVTCFFWVFAGIAAVLAALGALSDG